MIMNVFGIIVSIIFIIGGLGGYLVLRGTNSSELLVILGIILFIWNVYSIINRNKSE